MKNFSLLTVLLSIAMAFLAGCESTPKIMSEFNEDVDFSTYKNFAILPLPTSIPGADPGAVLRSGKLVEASVLSTLGKFGYQQVPLEEADFAVNLTGKVVPKTDITDWGYNYPPSRGWGGYYTPYYSYGSNVSVDQYEEGTLIIEIYDAKTKEMAWVGWGVGRRKSDAPDPDRLDALVSSILLSFPPEN